MSALQRIEPVTDDARIVIPDAAIAIARAIGAPCEAVVLACFAHLARIATGETSLVLTVNLGATQVEISYELDDDAPVEIALLRMRDAYLGASRPAGEVLLGCEIRGFVLELQIIGVRELALHDPDGGVGSAIHVRWAEVLAHLFAQVERVRATALRDVEVVPLSQRAALLELGANREVAGGGTIDDLFRACVRHTPDRRAVVDATCALTYAELDRRVEKLARHLRASGLAVGELVAVDLPPSVDIAVAMLGVMRARGAFVPLDPGMPEERRRFVLADAGVRFVIGAGGELATSDEPCPPGTGADAAYVIYTSGTSGEPKGVVVEQHSLVNYVRWLSARYAIDNRHVAALVTSFAFDLGYTVVWPTLCAGGELHFVPEAVCRDVAALPAYIQAHAITFLKVTPSLLGALVRSPTFDRARAGGLRLVFCGGEPIRIDDIATVYARCPEVLVVNHYGPTETTIGALTQPLARTRLVELASRPVIGRPVGDTRVYVASGSRLLPLGAPGELLIGGAGVARGYHNRPALTAVRFGDDPFAPGERIYRTGDLVRWTETGTLEFLGRRDRQVKIRGYRVELGEIEQVMLRRLAITQAVVIDRGSHGLLCAYYVADEPLDAASAREALGVALPDYMIPASFTRLAAVPRTANGKLDVARLPPPLGEPGPGPALLSATEETLAAIWRDILGAPCTSVEAHFFELGGHSLLAIQLLADIHDRFGIMLEMAAVFVDGTIRGLARRIDEARA